MCNSEIKRESGSVQAALHCSCPPPQSTNVTMQDFTVHWTSADLEGTTVLFISLRMHLIIVDSCSSQLCRPPLVLMPRAVSGWAVVGTGGWLGSSPGQMSVCLRQCMLCCIPRDWHAICLMWTYTRLWSFKVHVIHRNPVLWCDTFKLFFTWSSKFKPFLFATSWFRRKCTDLWYITHNSRF